MILGSHMFNFDGFFSNVVAEGIGILFTVLGVQGILTWRERSAWNRLKSMVLIMPTVRLRAALARLGAQMSASTRSRSSGEMLGFPVSSLPYPSSTIGGYCISLPSDRTRLFPAPNFPNPSVPPSPRSYRHPVVPSPCHQPT